MTSRLLISVAVAALFAGTGLANAQRAGVSKDQAGGGAATQQSATDTSRSQTTTGAATAGPPAEKRTQITSAIKSEKIEETTNVDFNVSVGATIPTSVRLHPLPPKIVEIYPEWRGYEVVL